MEDQRIISLLFSRSEEALKELEHSYGRLVRSIANNIVHNQETALECENDTWLAVWNTIPPTRPESLGNYVCRIVKNISLTRYRDEHCKKRNASIVQWDELEECLAGASMEDEAALHEITEAINGFLKKQEWENRMIWMSYYWSGVSVAEIAERLQLRKGAVKMRLSRMRMALRSNLEKEGLL